MKDRWTNDQPSYWDASSTQSSITRLVAIYYLKKLLYNRTFVLVVFSIPSCYRVIEYATSYNLFKKTNNNESIFSNKIYKIKRIPHRNRFDSATSCLKTRVVNKETSKSKNNESNQQWIVRRDYRELLWMRNSTYAYDYNHNKINSNLILSQNSKLPAKHEDFERGVTQHSSTFVQLFDRRIWPNM